MTEAADSGCNADVGVRGHDEPKEKPDEKPDEKFGYAASKRAHPAGALMLVATPIGNLGDLPPRAVEVLRDADIVACEDSRRTGRLLQSAGVVARRLVVVNDHTETRLLGELVGAVVSGAVVALVTDAGMPGIADPGQRLVAAMVERDLAVGVVPGPTAPVAALVLSGFDTRRFVVEGFLPRRGADRARRLAEVASERRTVVLLEAPHRVARTVEDLASHCGGHRRVALCRELTKLHEQVWRGTLDDAVIHCSDVSPRGEYVVVIEGAPPDAEPTDEDLVAALEVELAAGASRRDAAAAVAAATGVSRRRVYGLVTGR